MFLLPNVNFMVGPSCLPTTSNLSWLILLSLISMRPYSLLENAGGKGQGGVLFTEHEILMAGLNSCPTEYAWSPRTIQIQSVWMSALGPRWDCLLRSQCIWAYWIGGKVVWFCCPYSSVRNKEINCWNIYIKWSTRPGWSLTHCH